MIDEKRGHGRLGDERRRPDDAGVGQNRRAAPERILPEGEVYRLLHEAEGEDARNYAMLLPAVAWRTLQALGRGGADDPVFRSRAGGHLSTVQAWRIVRKAARSRPGSPSMCRPTGCATPTPITSLTGARRSPWSRRPWGTPAWRRRASTCTPGRVRAAASIWGWGTFRGADRRPAVGWT